MTLDLVDGTGQAALPAKPFADWLNAQYDAIVAARGDADIEDHDGILGPAEELAERLGWGASDAGVRKLYRYRKQLKGIKADGRSGEGHTDLFRRAAVEDALDHAGVPIEKIYPDLASEVDVELEPDAYCASCRDVVTPIGGICPWCDREVSADKPARLYCQRCDAAMFAANDGGCWRCGGDLASIPWIPCGCGCGAELTRFDSHGREVRFKQGHAPRRLERQKMVDPEPFATWLEEELRNLDPIQALARRTGLHRQELQDLLNRRVEGQIELSRVRRTLWLASREGQGKGMPPRPGSTGLADLYPDHVRTKVCPVCGGEKAPHAQRCRNCRRSPAGTRDSSALHVLDVAKRMRDEDGLSFPEIARVLQPRTRCTNVESLANQLRIEFGRRGWPTGRVDRRAA